MGEAGFGPGRASPELGQYWGEMGAPHSSTGLGWVLTLHLGWQGAGRGPHGLFPFSRTPLLPQPPHGVLLSPSPQGGWGAHPAPDGWAASCVGSRGAPRARGLSPAPSSPPAQALPSALTRELLCLPAGVGAQPYCTPQPARGCTADPMARGLLGQLKGCLWRAARCHPPLSPARTPPPCSDALPWQRCTPLVPGTDPERNLTSNGANPGPLPWLLPLCTRGAGGCGVGGAGLAPLGLFIAGAPPSTHPCTPQQHLGQGRGSPSSSNRGQHQ